MAWPKHIQFCLLALLLLASTAVNAADKYWKGGDGAWDTVTANWSLTSSGTVDQVWVPGDSAIIEGAAGTITLAADMAISNLHITANSTITGNSLLFGTGGAISNDASGLVLECGISGKPYFYMDSGSTPRLAPNSAPMALGTLLRSTDNFIKLAGSVSGNTISDIQNTMAGNVKNAKTSVEGSAIWTVEGDSYVGELSMNGGILIAEGVFTSLRVGSCSWNSGTLHLNATGVLGSAGFNFRGVTLDNSSGSAITSDPNNFNYSITKDTTFIGSQGTNSDLTLGSGAVTISVSSPTSDNIEMTVANSETRLTIGGPIGDGGNGYGITKSGAGTLQLDGNNTYVGETAVNEGVLDLRVASALAVSSGIRVDTNGILRLENADNGGATWDFAALSALNTNIISRLEPGTASNIVFTNAVSGYTDIYAAVPANPDSTAYWDGTDTTGNADGGAGAWDNSASNWDDAASGGASVAWDANSTSNDTAVFGGASGTVDLGADVDVRVVEINAAYQIGSNSEAESLNFNGFEPQINVNAANASIKAGITGAPGVHHGAGGNFTLEASTTSMHLGSVTRGADNYLYLRGDSTTNTIESAPRPIGFSNSNNVKFHKYGAGTWIVNGDFYAGEIYVWGGVFVCHGRLEENFRDIAVRGGTIFANGTAEGSVVYGTEGGTFGGTAVVYSGVSVPTNGVLAPGFPTGTMTITNNSCTINGTLEINVDGSQYSILAVDSGFALTISNATLNVNVGASTPGGDLIIATYGTLNGEFAATNGMDTWEIDYNYEGGNAIALLPPAAGTVLIIR